MNINNEKYNFQTLVPTENMENIGIYEDALDFVFQKANIKNIAISGAYCSGKSSLLETYKKRCEDNKKQEKGENLLSFLHISLAHFESQHLNVGSKEFETPNRQSEPSTGEIEGRIINQLIHQIDASQIPLSKFRAKKETPRRKVIDLSILIIVIASLTLLLTNYSEIFTNIVLRDSGSIFVETFLPVLWLLIDIIAIGICLYQAINTLINKCTFKKLSLRGTEIEVFGDDKESFFDKHLDDVLYILKNSKADVIVFEDIDRFDDNGIFEKLREINYLVNKKLEVEKDERIIRFIYMIRDDIFSSKDRTKFFDFIIPVIPVIDSTNSGDQLAKKLKKIKYGEKISESFLMSISLYVDDMRILNNTYNEYVIYCERVHTTEQDSEKLFSIILYKNLFPKDFGDLQLARGYLFELFKTKAKKVEKEKSEIETKIELKQKELQNIKEEQLLNENELDALFLLPPEKSFLMVKGQSESAFPNRATFVQAMKKNPTQISSYKGNGTRIDFDFAQALLRLSENPDTDYSVRKAAIKEKADLKISNRENQINNLLRQHKQVDKKAFINLITRDNVDEFFILKDDKDKQLYPDIQESQYFSLIKYLVQDGKIDETYKDYLTYFYGEFISERDKIFWRSIIERKAKKFDYKLDHPEKVANLLEGHYFEQEELLNFCMYKHLLTKKPKTEKNAENLRLLNKQIADNKRLDFVAQFIDESTEEEKQTFIIEISSIWTAIWNEIYSTDIFSEEKKKDFIYAAIYVLSKDHLCALNGPNSELTKYISENSTFLSADEPDVDKIAEGLQTLNVQFVDINFELSDKDLLKRVYELNLYEINEKTIEGFAKMFYGQEKSASFWGQCYSILREKKNEPLFKYVVLSNENKTVFLSCVLQNCEEKINDSEDAAAEILSDDSLTYIVEENNGEQVELDYREQYIIFLRTIISNIRLVSDKTIWSLLLQSQKVTYSVENILAYFYEYSNELDETLVTFLNSSKEQLNFQYSDIKSIYGQNWTDWFVKAFTCNDLSDERYEMIARTSKCQFIKIELHGIPTNRMDRIIHLNIIAMTAANLQFMRDEYSENLTHFIIKNIREYTNKIITKDNFDANELLELMNGSKVRDSHIKKLLFYTSIPISVKDFNCSEGIEQIVIERNFDDSDLAYFISNYEKRSNELRKLINNVCMKNLPYIITNKIRMGMSLLEFFLANDVVNYSDKADLFGLNLDRMKLGDVKGCLEILGKSDIILLFTKPVWFIEASTENEKLLKILKASDFIGKFKKDVYRTGYFKVYSLKKHRKQ